MTTITRFTKEQLIASAREKVKSLEFAVAQTAFADNHAELEEELELARIAQASIEAEAVAGEARFKEEHHWSPCTAAHVAMVLENPADWPNYEVRYLYAAPPAPVSVPDEVNVLLNHLEDVLPDDAFNLIDVKTWNSVSMLSRPDVYRTAMLQGSQPVSNRDELPLNYLHGHKDGLEWAAQLAEANHPQTGDWLYDDPTELAKAIRKGPDMPPVESGNSPVIGIDLAAGPDRTVEVRYFAPPGYVMVPKCLTAENGAKSVMIGEFSETKFINCPECFGDGDCETCDGSGRIKISVPVSWTNIKAIWAKGVEIFAAAPQQENRPTWYRIEWDSGDYSSHAEHELRAATVDEPRVYNKFL